MFQFDNSYARLPDDLYVRQHPVPVANPTLVMFNTSLADQLGLDATRLSGDEGAALFSGNFIPEGADPIAQAYAGHQFGHLNMLGDGRAVLLGEHHSPAGAHVDIQLKGSGRTAFSRSGDGRAALGPMLREYIISEAMAALHIPTTRSLAVVTTGEVVQRETMLPGAVLTRVAASHLRVGTFEYTARLGNPDTLRALADYAIHRHYPELEKAPHRYQAFLESVIDRQALLMVQWMGVGFIHGVMNTDNMAISGETIDYGPCAFMDRYDPATVFSSIDRHGRYAFANQPRIAQWNLTRFAECLLPLLHADATQAVKLAEEAVVAFQERFEMHRMRIMRMKLGIMNEEDADQHLVSDFLNIMHQKNADYTNTFRALSDDDVLGSDPDFAVWCARWNARRARQPESLEDSNQLMRNTNPIVIPRNHRVEEVLAACLSGGFDSLHRLLNAMEKPFSESVDTAFLIQPGNADMSYRTFCGT